MIAIRVIRTFHSARDGDEMLAGERCLTDSYSDPRAATTVTRGKHWAYRVGASVPLVRGPARTHAIPRCRTREDARDHILSFFKSTRPLCRI
jgi:hypothetical protein